MLAYAGVTPSYGAGGVYCKAMPTPQSKSG